MNECCSFGDFHELWWVLKKAYFGLCYNCGEFHELWWVLKHDSILWHIMIVVIFMNCGGFRRTIAYFGTL